MILKCDIYSELKKHHILKAQNNIKLNSIVPVYRQGGVKFESWTNQNKIRTE